MIDDPFNAFCSHATARLEGAKCGPLAGLTFAAKDLFDIAGHVTGAGNPDWLRLHEPATRTAPVVQQLVHAGATMVGKTQTDELSRGIFGENAHYGTPINPRAAGRLPGGSSSGSAVAVAGGIVDFALGSDTGGSVRIPASFCGIYGIRPTHGALPLEGMVGNAPSFDTVGWFARDPALLAKIGAVLLHGSAQSARPRSIIVAEDAFAVAEPATAAALAEPARRLTAFLGRSECRALSTSVPLADWYVHQRAIQGAEAWGTFGDWIDRCNPRFAFEIADNFLRGMRIDEVTLANARNFRAARRTEILPLLEGGTVVCLPTAPFPAPPRGQRRSAQWGRRVGISTLTSIAGMLGAPQISLPVAEVDGLPIGLSIIGSPGADHMLLELACAMAAADPGCIHA
jgi:amidase